MCGIVAVINKYTNGFTQTQLDTFESLLYIDGLRGLDSTGVICVENTGAFSIVKGACPVTTFLGEKDWTTINREAYTRGSALIGHNRKATKGVISDDNAHPFIINDEFALVHNGTMYGDHRKYAQVDVDSHAIAHYIHEHGVEASIAEINAAYCFFWYDHRNKTVNLLRNGERPMSWMETSDGYYYASEGAFLDFVVKRHNLKLIGKGIVMQPEYCHSIFNLEGKSWGVDAKQYKKPEPKVYTQPPFRSQAAYTWPDDVDTAYDFQKWEKEAADSLAEANRAAQEEVRQKDVPLQLAIEYELSSPKSIMPHIMEAASKVTRVHACIIGYEKVKSQHGDEYYLYFTSVAAEEPFLFRQCVLQSAYTEEELTKLIKEKAIFDLQAGGIRYQRKVFDAGTHLNEEEYCMIISCVTAKLIELQLIGEPV